MNESERCQRRTLAHRDPFQVDACGCGTLHVMFGALTLRLPAAGCEALAVTLLEALRELAHQHGETVQ